MIKGKDVKIRKTVLFGEIIQKRFNESRDEMEYLVAYDDDNDKHQRWFVESELEAV